MLLSIVVPCYNEEAVLRATHQRLTSVFADMAGIEYVLIGKDTKLADLKNQLRWSEVYYQVNK